MLGVSRGNRKESEDLRTRMSSKNPDELKIDWELAATFTFLLFRLVESVSVLLQTLSGAQTA